MPPKLQTSTYERFKNLNPDRVQGTCKWALQHPQYKRWHQSLSDDLLWITADPGCGKSVLAKSLIDQELQVPSKHTVCYFFFKDNVEQNSLAKALSALLHQFFGAKPELLKYAMDSYTKSGNKLRDEVDELWRILMAASKDERAGTVICVLDALDECQADDRQRLIKNLINFYADRATMSMRHRVKFLVTSRSYLDIRSGFSDIPSGLPSIRLAGEEHNADIGKEINLVIKAEVQKAGREHQLNRDMRDILQKRLLETSNRTYLWLHLVVKELPNIDQTTTKAFQKDINLLPRTVEQAYERILSRNSIERQHKAQKLLHIIVGARRPLKLQELYLAYQIATDSSDAEEHVDLELENPHFESHIRDLCGLFIFVNDSRVYLIHQTAKEFLVTEDSPPSSDNDIGPWAHSLDFQHSDTIMTQICVQYLSFRDFSDNCLTTSKREADVDTDIYPFLNYSAVHWPAHLRNARFHDKKLQRRILGLYDTQSHRFQTWASVFLRTLLPWETESEFHSVHLAAFNGHRKVLGMLLDSDPANLNLKDGKGRIPLIWGCRGGHKKVVQMLLDKGAEVNARSMTGLNTLETASQEGHKKVVRLLLKHGADVNANDGTALRTASYWGNTKVVKILLKNGADVDARFGTALEAASSRGHEKIVQILLKNGAKAVA